ncbi:uncharacterized protein E0L32_004408 [Thyridium curvatum]|uniref:Protein YOP1 n=1 Tax=Thyridium curvatum TaxID=1093900 RepID=A0A507BFD6_9PEZI|nr:uncharacterized protein E0L32_004408 [Thyridium curvatum]TPX15428.1 hypothetical protein E0L32_004408 [Thyridium curvatum]
MVFDIFAKALSSVASFLFPLFASYKALKTSDPAELTPWLMYWVVLACALLVESWFEWILMWIPFYAYLRLLFLLYLVLPQTQGARIIYQTYIHPWLQDNESQIEDFIASAHDRLRAAGVAYLKRAIELVKTNILGMPPSEPQQQQTNASAAPQSYTQSLLARFSLPSARWPSADAAGTAGADFYNLLASAVSAATSAAATSSSSSSNAARAAATTRGEAVTASGTLIPPTVRESERMSFLATQRERLTTLLFALDREAAQLQEQQQQQQQRGDSMSLDREAAASAEGGDALQRKLSAQSGLSKSRSEADFEKIEAESGAEDLDESARPTPSAAGGSGSWMPWGWAGAAAPDKKKDE